MQQQLPLNLKLGHQLTFDNFLPAGNEKIIAYLNAMVTEYQEPFMYLWGKTGSGRSHLLQASCHLAARHGLSTTYLPLTQLAELSPAVLTNLENLALICLDDIDAIAGISVWEEALFHLINRLRETQHSLIVAASCSPRELKLTLPDLQSRLSWGAVFHLEELSDELKIPALQLQAEKRGMLLSAEVAEFLLHRAPRDMLSLFEVLETLDKASLSLQRKLTIPFVKQVLSL